ncbi:hypothetical protein XELAEV_18007152mg [Xenopus laevis]|uniref:Ig-like domain-containing protein n=1 Tax=Xenopus laevis TaxID=8355 RepID=A0A974E103_XENLA|nr:hypothetical protein XELAEV_18007152mg [Xenopus laevis]
MECNAIYYTPYSHPNRDLFRIFTNFSSDPILINPEKWYKLSCTVFNFTFSNNVISLAALGGHCILSQTLQESGPGTVKPSESLRLTCTVSGFELTSYHVHWNRQPPGRGLEWIGLVRPDGSTAIADSLKNRVTITRDTGKKQVYLQMNGMEVKDTAMYYCAGETQ